MSIDKKALLGAAIAIGLAVTALISVLSASNGQLRQEIKTLKSQSGGEFTQSSERIDKSSGKIEKLEGKLERLDRQVQENVDIANANYDKYNRLVVEVDAVLDDIKGTSKTRLLKAIDRIKSTDVQLDRTGGMQEEHSS